MSRLLQRLGVRKVTRRKIRYLRRFLTYHLTYVFALLLVKAARRLPWRFCSDLGDGLGRAAYYLCFRERRRSLAHLQIAFGRERNPSEIRALARASFGHLGRGFFEAVNAGPIAFRLLDISTSSTSTATFRYVVDDPSATDSYRGQARIFVTFPPPSPESIGRPSRSAPEAPRAQVFDSPYPNHSP